MATANHHGVSVVMKALIVSNVPADSKVYLINALVSIAAGERFFLDVILMTAVMLMAIPP